MSDFVNITSNDQWFKQHPEKIAGVEVKTTSLLFPIQVKGTKEDVINAIYGNTETETEFKPHYKNEVLEGYYFKYKNKDYFLALDADLNEPYGIAIGNGNRIYSLNNNTVKDVWKGVKEDYVKTISTTAKKIKLAQIKLRLAKAKLNLI